jgi:5-hydroxyisourate hydrolase-like protein (transthyretin family)
MDIKVNVIDGVHGRPAEGVEVRVACQDGPGGERVEKACDWTNERGQARYTERRADYSGGDNYAIEIDADFYFASLGVASWQRKIILLFRIIDPADEYQVMSVLTPLMQVTFCARQPGA